MFETEPAKIYIAYYNNICMRILSIIILFEFDSIALLIPFRRDWFTSK